MQQNREKVNAGKTGGSLAESAVVAVLSALGFIAWGLWVNWDYGMASRVQVALTQGGISLVATFSSTELLRVVARCLAGVRWRRLLTGSMGWILINGLVFFAHWIFGTPEILKTMAVGMVGGVFFCGFYAVRLSRG